MTSINSFYRDPNAVANATQLFSSVKAQATQNATAFQKPKDATVGTDLSSGQRALARIIEILSLGDPASTDQANVSESIGYITGAAGTDSNDTLTLTGRGIYNVDTGTGDDSLIAKSAAIASLTLGDGKDSLKATAGLIADIDGGAGDDDIQLTDSLIMNVAGGDGNDSIKASGQALVGIDGGDGDDTMYLEGNRIFASGGKGNDAVTIHQTGEQNRVVEYAFARGDGADTIATDGPLSIRFTGYSQNDMTITQSNNSLTIKMNGSSDMMTISIDTVNNTSSNKLRYEFTSDKGQTVLKIL